MAIPCPACGRDYDVTLFQFGRGVRCDCGSAVSLGPRVRPADARRGAGEAGISDAEVVELLRWALPRLGLRWKGYRRVRGQVRKRIARRMAALGLRSAAAYRERLERDPAEWPALGAACRITISRFWRDRGVFERLRREVLPALAREATRRGDATVRAWSAGCGSGEEPYGVRLAWEHGDAGGLGVPRVALELTASDADARLLERARRAVYPESSLRELPEELRRGGFRPCRDGTGFEVRPELREGIVWLEQDLRREMPAGPFDLVLCRNLAFTYFDDPSQRRVLEDLVERLRPGAALVIGSHETLPEGTGPSLRPWDGERAIRRAERP